MFTRTIGSLSFAALLGCGSNTSQVGDPGALATKPTSPSLSMADSLLTQYLASSIEGHDRAPRSSQDIHSDADECLSEMFGDFHSSYWLANGRILGYERRADTLRSRLELLTVAEQVPVGPEAYDSEVRARIATDTLELKLVPDSTGSRWQICGWLSNDHDLGGFGTESNVRYKPNTVSRTSLLRQIDSIRNDNSLRR
jgi:hypothetical protein